MIVEILKGFSEGFMSGFSEDELNEHFAEMGVTIVYISDERHVYLDDSVNPEEAQYYLSTHAYRRVAVDWKRFRNNHIRGYGALHPYH